jgi:hypothetical protein
MSERNGADGKAVPHSKTRREFQDGFEKVKSSKQRLRAVVSSLAGGPSALLSSHHLLHRVAAHAFFVQPSGNRSPRIIRFDPAASNMATGPCRYPNVMLNPL